MTDLLDGEMVVNTWLGENTKHVLDSPTETLCGRIIEDRDEPGQLKHWWTLGDAGALRDCQLCLKESVRRTA